MIKIEDTKLYKALEPFFKVEWLSDKQAELSLFHHKRNIRPSKLYDHSYFLKEEMEFRIKRKKRELCRDMAYLIAGDNFREFERDEIIQNR